MIEQVRSYRFTIKQIFKEHWENYLSQHKGSLCQGVIWTIEKMLSCRNPEKLGYHSGRDQFENQRKRIGLTRKTSPKALAVIDTLE